MKAIKTITMAALMAASFVSLGSAQTASAPTPVYITGSTAYRANATAGIENILEPDGTVIGSTTYHQYRGWDGSAADANVANHSLIYGALKTGSHDYVAIYTSWNGSAGGVQAVAGAAAGNTFNLSYIAIPASYTVSGNYNNNMTVSQTVNGGNMAFSDVAQATTGWQGSVTYTQGFNGSGTPNNPTTKSFSTLNQLSSTGVGVVPFVFVTSPNSPITNITPQLAQGLWANGQFSLALFDGVPADESKYAFATGRNPDSGTRMAAFAETQIGVSTQVVQNEPLVGGVFKNGSVNNPITSQQVWPTDSTAIVNGTSYPAGDSGYVSGGSLSKDLSNDTSALGGYYVSYLGTSDAVNFLATQSSTNGTTNGSALLPAGTALTYNGYALPIVVSVASNTGAHAAGFDTTTVTTTAGDGTTATSSTTTHTYSGTSSTTLGGQTYPSGYVITATINNNSIVQGQYTYWSYEHLYYPTLTGDASTVATNLSNDLANTDAQITIPSMNVARNSDGGEVTSNNY